MFATHKNNRRIRIKTIVDIPEQKSNQYLYLRCMLVCACACVRVCVRACVRACVRVYVWIVFMFTSVCIFA